MTTILGRFTKQSQEILDYDVDFTDWFEGRTSSPSTFTVSYDDGITVVSSARTGNVVKVVLSGGTNGEKYKITVRLTTTDNLVKEADFIVRIKDV